MDKNEIFQTDYYVISKDFKLISFNDSVAKTYKGVKIGDFCYKATMKRDSPCLHCPIAGNSTCDSPIYYDPFYKDWVEAIFSYIGDDKYAVTCRIAKDSGLRVFDSLGRNDIEALINKVSGGAVNDKLMEMELQLKKSAFEQKEQFEKILILNKELQDKQRSIEESQLKAERANEAKTKFLFNMSHDIRTPMNAIVGYAELLKRNLSNEELCKDYIEKMQNASEFLLSLINNVLEMARIESGKYILDETTANIDLFVSSLLSLFEQSVKTKKLNFIKDIDINHNFIFCDPVKLREIYLNVISNAIKYTPDGGTIGFELKELPSDREGYAVYQAKLTDTGIGMSKDYLPIMFDEFSRERNSTDSKIEGTGLGLPIVKKLIELMNGTINVESELGKGTSVTITLSHKIADNSTLAKSKPENINIGSFKGKRILLAEDNDLNAEIATAILEDFGIIVERANDGVICIDKLIKAEENYYDLIFMDIQMPNLNGYEASKRIRKMESKKADIPIVAMTANALMEDKQNAIAYGMNDHISKPIDLQELEKILVLYL